MLGVSLPVETLEEPRALAEAARALRVVRTRVPGVRAVVADAAAAVGGIGADGLTLGVELRPRRLVADQRRRLGGGRHARIGAARQRALELREPSEREALQNGDHVSAYENRARVTAQGLVRGERVLVGAGELVI